MTDTMTASQRGRRNRANGAAYEVKTANYLKAWWPDACRAVRSSHPDPGDVDNTSPSFWWSVKNCQVEQYNAWFREMDDKAAGRIALLVVRRRGYADPGRWWCWLTLHDLTVLLGSAPPLAFEADDDARVCVELATVVPLLRAYTQPAAVAS